MKSPKLVHVRSKNIGLPRWSIGMLAGGTADELNSLSRIVKALTMFGNFSATLFSSHGSLMTSNMQGLESGLQIFTTLLAQVTVESLRNFLEKQNFYFNSEKLDFKSHRILMSVGSIWIDLRALAVVHVWRSSIGYEDTFRSPSGPYQPSHWPW